jgi:hypothetical protein
VIGAIITAGFGAFSAAWRVITRGFGAAAIPPTPPTPGHRIFYVPADTGWMEVPVGDFRLLIYDRCFSISEQRAFYVPAESRSYAA